MTEQEKAEKKQEIWNALNKHPVVSIDRVRIEKTLQLGIDVLVDNGVFKQRGPCWDNKKAQGDINGALCHLFIPGRELDTLELVELTNIPLPFYHIVNELFQVLPQRYAQEQFPKDAFNTLYTPPHYYMAIVEWAKQCLIYYLPFERVPVVDKILAEIGPQFSFSWELKDEIHEKYRQTGAWVWNELWNLTHQKWAFRTASYIVRMIYYNTNKQTAEDNTAVFDSQTKDKVAMDMAMSLVSAINETYVIPDDFMKGVWRK